MGLPPQSAGRSSSAIFSTWTFEYLPSVSRTVGLVRHDGFCSYAVAGHFYRFVTPAGVNKGTGAALLDPKSIR